MRARFAASVALALILASTASVHARKRGITGRTAPAIAGQWLNLQPGESPPDPTNAKGKVVYLFFFQSWCPGCHSRGFPTLRDVMKRFEGDARVQFAAVQTVFEGFGANDATAAVGALVEHSVDVPVAHDPGPGGRGSTTMRRYRSGGTPWTVIIGPDGVVRFDGFRISSSKATRLIERLLPKS
jgi:thiol-disulfide isomerase/thioredoxin